MRSTALPSVGNFRSNVQRFLEGNTPNHQTEVFADFVISLRALAPLLSKQPDQIAPQSIERLASICKQVSRKELQEGQKLHDVILAITNIVDEKLNSLIETQEFREVVVQLIVVAETLSDIQLKKTVLELSRKL
ncbi:MAG: hypothetical protein WAW73_03280 [Rhodoferax sp.]